MKRFVFGSLAAVLAVSVLVSGFCLFSEQGISLCIRVADALLPGRLSVAAVRGRPADRLTLDGVRYEDASAVVAIETISLAWRPVSLLHGTIAIGSLAAAGVDIAAAGAEPADAGAAREDILSPLFSLPLSVQLDRMTVERVKLFLPAESPVQVTAFSLENALVNGDGLRFERVSVAGPAWRIVAGGEIANGKTAEIRISGSYVLHPEGYGPIEGSAEIEGTLASLHYTARLRRPFAGMLRGSVFDPMGKAGWQAELLTDRAELAAISSEWPDFVFSDFQAHGSGTLSGYSLQVQSTVDYAGIRGIRVRTAVDGDPHGLELSNTCLSRKEGFLTGQGRLDWRKGFTWQGELSGTGINLSAISPDWPDMTVSDVTVSGTGEGETYSLRFAADAALPSIPPVYADAVMEGDGDGLRFTRATVSRMESTVSGQGWLSWKDGFTWQAAVEGGRVDPSVLLPQWPGRLDFRGRSFGRMVNGKVRAEIYLDDLAGELRGYPLRAGGAAAVEDGTYVVEHLRVETAGSVFEASGSSSDAIDFRFAVQSSDLAELWPGAEGGLQARGRFGGSRHQPVIELEMTGDSLAFEQVRIGSLAADATGDLAPDGKVRATVRAEDLTLGGSRWKAVHLQLHGLTGKHRLQAEARGHGVDALLALDGGFSEKGWKGSVSRADIASERFGAWQLAEPAQLRLAAGDISLAPVCLCGTGTARVCLAGELQPEGPWQARAEIHAVPLSLLTGVQGEALDIRGMLTGSAAAEGEGPVVLGGRLALSADDVSLLPALPGISGQRLTWRENAVRAQYDDGLLTAAMNSTLQDGSFLHSSVVLTDIRPAPFSLAAAHVEGSLDIGVTDLALLAPLTFPHVETAGALRGSFSLRGPVAEPSLEGSAELLNGKMIVLPLGITLEELRLIMEARAQMVDLRLTGKSDGGTMTAEAEFSWPPAGDEPILVTVSGDRFELVNSPDLRLRVSPDLDMRIIGRQAEMRGTILVPEALIAPRNFGGTVSPSRDVIIVGSRQEKETGNWSLNADVVVVAGDKVQIDAFGLKGKIDGRLRVRDLPAKPAIGEGTLQVKEGTFSIYGRELQIAAGRLLFSGGPLDNPGIEARAENVSGGITTGIQVSGFLSEPEISFYSSPPMREDEIISRLLTDTSLIGSTAGDGGFLGGVTEGAGMERLSSTLQDVRQGLNVDDIRIETGKAREDLSLVIGTWLSPSLYVSYGKNLLKESGSFNTRYLLGHGFFMESETGSTQNGVDLKYEIER